MKRSLLFLCIAIFILSLSNFSGAATTSIPMSLDYWNFTEVIIPQSGGGSPSYEETAEGICFYGSGYRNGTEAVSKITGDFSDATIQVKWKTDEQNYMGLGTGFGKWDEINQSYERFSAIWGTTHHSWAGSTVLYAGIWYYTTIVITPDQQYTGYIATGNYYDEGGTVVYTKTESISDIYWPYITDCSLSVFLMDNYTGQSANMTIGEAKFTSNVAPEPSVIDINPDILNLKSKGNWITCYMELPEDYDLNDIDTDSVMLSFNEAVIMAETSPVETGDYDNDGIMDLMVKFDRESVHGSISEPGEIEMTVTAESYDGVCFEGVDTLIVSIDNNGKKHIKKKKKKLHKK